jgi:molybdopterin synthase catalytic subunit
MSVRIQTEDFDLTREVAALRGANAAIGAVVSFIGTVRDINQDAAVSEMALEHYAGMTERALERIEQDARERWPLQEVLVVHRVGPLKPLEQIVLVAVAAAHRGEAFAACEYIIDYLKTEAPFWKKEKTPQGERWVDARDADRQAMLKWIPGNGAEGEEAI